MSDNVYVRISDTEFGVAGDPSGLTPGAIVEVSTRSGETRTETLGDKVKDDPQGRAVYAVVRKPREGIIWRRHPDGRYLIHGPAAQLGVGADVAVTSAKGETRTETVEALLDSDRPGHAFAVPVPKARYRKLDDGSYGVFGRNLEPGGKVAVHRRDGSSAEETLGEKVADHEDGTATFRLTRTSGTGRGNGGSGGTGNTRGQGRRRAAPAAPTDAADPDGDDVYED